MAGNERYGIEELAALGGVTRRTVRYYVQEGLLPSPLGVGRGRHYGPAHLARLQEVKGLLVPRSAWTRLEVVPGVELHVSGRRRLPSPGRLRELAEWCERHFRGSGDE
jgi:hypothetical protein